MVPAMGLLFKTLQFKYSQRTSIRTTLNLTRVSNVLILVRTKTTVVHRKIRTFDFQPDSREGVLKCLESPISNPLAVPQRPSEQPESRAFLNLCGRFIVECRGFGQGLGVLVVRLLFVWVSFLCLAFVGGCLVLP